MNGANIVHNELKLIIEGYSYFHDLAFVENVSSFVMLRSLYSIAIIEHIFKGYIYQIKPYHIIKQLEDL